MAIVFEGNRQPEANYWAPRWKFLNSEFTDSGEILDCWYRLEELPGRKRWQFWKKPELAIVIAFAFEGSRTYVENVYTGGDWDRAHNPVVPTAEDSMWNGTRAS